MNRITTAQKTLEYYVVLSGESTPPVPTPTQVTIDGNFEIEQSGSTYTMSFGIQNFDWSSLESGWTGTVVYGQTTLTFDSSNLNNNTITISVSESQIDLTATTATMEITSGTDEYEGTANVEVGFVDYMFVENTYNGTNTLTLTTTTAGSPSSSYYSTTVEYSKDRTNWTTVTFDTSTPYNITMNQGEKVYFRNNTGVFNYRDTNGTVYYYTSITSTNTINAGGNINSLFDYTNMSSVDVSSTVGGLYRLFNQSVYLVNANNIVIPQTTYPDFFLCEIFNHCESLVTTPNFNNVVNIGYASCTQMFGYCYSLVIPPDFNSLTTTGTRSGFSWAFHDCSSLIRTPSFNSLITFGNYGFNQTFANCSSLTDIRIDFTRFTSIPQYGINRCFQNCSGLEVGPDLHTITSIAKNSLSYSFNGCVKLRTVYCPNLSSWSTTYAENWLNNCGGSATGETIAYVPNISIPTTVSGVPSIYSRITY